MKYRAARAEQKQRFVGVIDSETDPFDNVKRERIRPFLFVIYTDEFDPIILWDENYARLIERLVSALDAIKTPYTFYAHNGGKFDFMFLIHKLRGKVSFKGRGVMEAKIGIHTLRDSFHIIPEKLASYQKQKFNYEWLRKDVRQHYKKETIEYCLSDCRYLLDLVKGFISQFGLRLSIGQAAMAELRKHYTVEKFSGAWDEYMRGYFFGGRVECLQGRGMFMGDYKLYDVNSMYPHVMANYQHPIGGFFDYNLRVGEPGPDTVFLDLNCTNRGALIARNAERQTVATIRRGRFQTTIWEYEMALRHNLISEVEINFCVDCGKRSDFSKFVLPLYENRLKTKAALRQLKKDGAENTTHYLEIKKDDIFYKLLLNNAYGKFAQNPRNFKEHYLTDPDEMPPPEWMESIEAMPPAQRAEYLLPAFECGSYWIWVKPSPGFSFNNVGTAASITGAARALLMDAICKARDPIYCDTDSLICRDLPDVEIHSETLGAWDIEREFNRVIIAGKKLYSYGVAAPGQSGPSHDIVIKSKGVTGLDWDGMARLLDGAVLPLTNTGPTLTKSGEQIYITRNMRATAAIRDL